MTADLSDKPESFDRDYGLTKINKSLVNKTSFFFFYSAQIPVGPRWFGHASTRATL